MSKEIQIALVGNPNTGKTSVFNVLTGLRQKVGNYPGVTVEKKEGWCSLPQGSKARILDLPGTYSLHTNSLDESITKKILLNRENKEYPDLVVFVADIAHLKRNLLLFTQIKDLHIPTILVINMADNMKRKGIFLDIPSLETALGTKIVLVSTHKKTGLIELKELIENYEQIENNACLDISRIDEPYFEKLQKDYPKENMYQSWLLLTDKDNWTSDTKKQIQSTTYFTSSSELALKKMQHRETVLRYQFIKEALKKGYEFRRENAKGLNSILDKILTHKVYGYAIFLVILLFIFQIIYHWSGIPMDFIDTQFANLSTWIADTMPAGALTDLIAKGIVPGIGGVVIFIPQITFLFLFMSLLEESGYMNRVVFLMDKLLRPFGLSGKSVVPFMLGTACAIPAVMASRNIEKWNERLITMLVLPFTTCSARLPVYIIIIALVIPADQNFMGFEYQALALMFLYLLGFGMAIFSSWVLKQFIQEKRRTFFMVELPDYKIPLLKNVLYTLIEKTKSFVFGVGKIILPISIVIWFLSSYGSSDSFKDAAHIVDAKIETEGFHRFNQQFISDSIKIYEVALKDSLKNKTNTVDSLMYRSLLAVKHQALTDKAREDEITSYKLEHSYMGQIGKVFEPLVKPLGYDWKIGIGVLASFAAREVFVGTLATIYSVGSSEQEQTIKERLATETNKDTGKPLFNLASGWSILLFYVFAMQCMSTLAIVKKETNSWKWPFYQLLVMSFIAYITAMLAYQLLK